MIRHLYPLARYFATAGVAAIVDLIGFAFLQGSGWSIGAAAAVSFLIATVVNYRLTARFVFSASVSVRGYFKFLLAATLGFVVNVGVTIVSVKLIGMSPVVAKLAGIGLAFLVNFALNVIFVFGKHDSRDRR